MKSEHTHQFPAASPPARTRVSILMPAYNAEKYIAEALDSVLAQTHPHLEVIVVDDGSTDGTARVLETYRNRGVQVIHQPNRGQCAAANAAFRACTGQFIKFFDADDVLSPRFIELQLQALDGHPGCIASAEWGRFYDGDSGSARFQPEPVWRDMEPMDWLVASLQTGGNMMQCGLWLIPRHILAQSGLWDERLSLINDFDFFIRVLLASRGVRFAAGARLHYRSGLAGSLSGQYSRKAMQSAWLSTWLGTAAILDKEDSPRTRRVCADACQTWAYTFYPDHPDLGLAAEKRAAELGGSRLPVPGGRWLQGLAQVVGWKKAKRLHRLAYSFGYAPSNSTP